MLRGALIVLVATNLFAADHNPELRLELRGQISGLDSGRWFQVTVFGIESPYRDSAPVSSDGEFRFRSLAPGNYTIAVAGETGEVRRTVVVSAALAGNDGVIRANIPFTLTEASQKGSGVVSVRQLAIPKKAATWYADAQKRLANRDAAGAVDDLQRAVKIAPEFSAAWNALGVISFQSGDDVASEQYFRRALEADPSSFEPAVNLGGILLKKGSNQEALVCNLGAVQARPEDALANAQLGMTYFQHGDFALAEKYLIAAKKLDPAHFSQPQLFLAEIYARRGERNRAAKELEELLVLRPDGPGAETIRREQRKLQTSD